MSFRALFRGPGGWRLTTLFSCLVWLLALEPASVLAQSHPFAPFTVVVANDSIPGSVELARYYAEKRGIPERNLITISVPSGEIVHRAEYVQLIHNPILEQLVERGFLVGELSDTPNALGKRAFKGENRGVRYLALVYGVPYRVRAGAAWDDASGRDFYQKLVERLGQADAKIENFFSGPVDMDNSSVDGDLSLLLHADAPFRGFVPNPLFGKQNVLGDPDILRISRLDGPTLESARALVDNALLGEKLGLRGRAYIDPDGRDTTGYEMGNQWIRGAGDIAKQLGFDVDVKEGAPLFLETDRFDAPAIYFGWYTGSVSGPFRLPGFKFPPGAIAAHLHSYSADDMRNPEKWAPGLVASGVTATLGNVWEPYLPYTHAFNMMLAALGSGVTWADAGYFSIRALSWQAILVGDPLYQPFKVDQRQQLAQLEAVAEPDLRAYTILRQINLSLAQNGAEAALSDARVGWEKFPGVANGYRYAQMLLERKDRKAAREVLRNLPVHTRPAASEWVFYGQIAQLMVEQDEDETAFRVFRSLMEQPGIPRDLEKLWLAGAIKAASGADERDYRRKWKDREDEIFHQEAQEAWERRLAAERRKAEEEEKKRAEEDAKKAAEKAAPEPAKDPADGATK